MFKNRFFIKNNNSNNHTNNDFNFIPWLHIFILIIYKAYSSFKIYITRIKSFMLCRQFFTKFYQQVSMELPWRYFYIYFHSLEYITEHMTSLCYFIILLLYCYFHLGLAMNNKSGEFVHRSTKCTLLFHAKGTNV